MSKLSADCLNEIFEYLEDDKFTLYSCILVSNLCCEVSVRILWRNVCNYNKRTYNTLISCLPNESKEILSKNGITISVPTSKLPIFNYASFCKVLSINQVHYKIEELLQLENQQFNWNWNNINNKHMIVMQEICKMIMKQTSAL